MDPSNIALANGLLTLTTKNTGTGSQQSADLYSQASMLYGSFRMRAQITGSPGAVAGFFAYADDNNEQDIEILTNEAENRIHFTTHDDGGAGDGNPTLNTTMGVSRSEFVDYRFDWSPGKAAFFVDGVQVGVLTTAVPTKPCTLNLNMWSAGAGWGGEMEVGGEAHLKVQWIEAVYNPAAAAAGRARRARSHGAGFERERRQVSGGDVGGCKNVCTVDGRAAPGSPVPV